MAGRLLLTALPFGALAAATELVSQNGDKAAIPSWDLESSSNVGKLAPLSRPGADVSAWHHAETSRCTLMGCLIEAGVYDDADLWFSDNLRDFNWGQFSVPWVYRSEFKLAPEEGRHFILQTNGISSKADLFLNGEKIADSEFQAGSYVGHDYDITDLAAKDNALVIQAYPTNYFYDLALGFVDWNPYPPDNGTGVWRDVTVKQTGAVSLGPLTISINLEEGVGKSPAQITLRTTATNLEDREVEFAVKATIADPSGAEEVSSETSITVGPKASKLVEITETLQEPEIWWPKQWGEQPLYEATLTSSVDKAKSDAVSSTFGVRTVTYELNDDEDGMFIVNGEPFQVVGGGYSADMFLRWDSARFESIVAYMLDLGLNTIRLEGKNEHPELYAIADRFGLMVMAGWECCNKWESWSYNPDLSVDPVPIWDDHDYEIANGSMSHDALMQQPHPSMLAFLVGSDYWPNDRATAIYVGAFERAFWEIPIIAAASKRGFPDQLGPSGMKMEGPYDWVPPNYWYDREPGEDRYGSAFGFGSELGAGVGTPEIGSLRKFLTEADMEDLWKRPNKGLYHMSTNVSQFYDRTIYNDALWARYGAPDSLDDYLLKAQIMDYEAIRAEHEAFAMKWNTGRVATGMIYWMLLNAWPSLHWNQFDYYLHPGGSYFGSKVGARFEHVAYDYVDKSVWIINHSLDRNGPRTIEVEVIDLEGKVLSTETLTADTTANVASRVESMAGLADASDVVFLRLILSDESGEVLSRNVYWLAPTIDDLVWANSTWYYTPVETYADYTSLAAMSSAEISATIAASKDARDGSSTASQTVVLENLSSVPAFFVRLNLVDESGEDVLPVLWSDNYVTLWPKEKLELQVTSLGEPGAAVEISGGNIEATSLSL